MQLVRDEHGSVMVEYALVLSLLSILFLGGMTAIGTAASTALTNVQFELLHYGLRDNQ